MALGEPSPGLVAHKRTVEKIGWSRRKGTVNEELTGRGEQQIFPPHYFGHIHRRIINHHRKLIGRNIFPVPKDKVSEIPSGQESTISHSPVRKSDQFAIRHPEPPVCAIRGLRGHSGPGCGPPFDRIDWFLRPGVIAMRRSRCFNDIFSRPVARINPAAVLQFLPRIEVEVAPSALAIRSPHSSAVGAFVPVDSKPSKIFRAGRREFGPAAGGIQIFDSQNHRRFHSTRPAPRR